MGPLWREGAGSRQAHKCLCLLSEVVLRECHRQINVSGGSLLTVGPKISAQEPPRKSWGPGGKAGTTDATSCNSQVQAAPLGAAAGSEGQGKLAVGTGNWSSTWARRGSKWVDELSAGLEGP